jgi:hypothetical protein
MALAKVELAQLIVAKTLMNPPKTYGLEIEPNPILFFIGTPKVLA